MNGQSSDEIELDEASDHRNEAIQVDDNLQIEDSDQWTQHQRRRIIEPFHSQLRNRVIFKNTIF